jgi:hypothetical protein
MRWLVMVVTGSRDAIGWTNEKCEAAVALFCKLFDLTLRIPFLHEL